jgi:pimeloyl-ACP methyl ester carboxylesterase
MLTPRPPRVSRPVLAAAVALALGGAGATFASAAPGFALPFPPKTPDPQVAFAPLAHVEVRGAGPIPIILIPGAGCDWSVYDTFMTRNAQKYTMYAVTLPGFGKSDPPAKPSTPPTADAWLTNAELAILKLVEDRKLERPVIAGHSLGGHLAYRLAARHGDKFRSAISIDGLTWVPLQDLTKGAGTLDYRRNNVEGQLGAELLHRRTDEKWKAQALENAPHLSKDKARGEAIGKMMGSVPSAVVGRYFLEYVSGDLTNEVTQIKIPTLSIIAISDLEDHLRPKAAQRAMRLDQVKDAPMVTAVIFDDTRHMIMDDRPEELDAAIAAFLTGKPVPGAVKTATPPAPSEGAGANVGSTGTTGADKK